MTKNNKTFTAHIALHSESGRTIVTTGKTIRQLAKAIREVTKGQAWYIVQYTDRGNPILFHNHDAEMLRGVAVVLAAA